ncbi:MAG: HD domain-containing protein [Bacilli bacterium]|nr:HD domain-containing protein [Bacilli bacterium]
MKKIKDPIYGYILINDDIIPLIDSPSFQRLRNVIQTSYTAVYPSTLHNRFTHSLGVYHLGKIAFNSLKNNSFDFLENIDNKIIDDLEKSFILACLCHDLGHSPFSHTGEVFYNKEQISIELRDIIDNSDYTFDLNRMSNCVCGKEHEIMSALLTLRVFPDIIKKEYYDFFSRCIIGLKYTTSKKTDKEIDIIILKNACIELLNSSIIDVDKLDYLIRDSYMSGYLSSSIDYQRLLEGVSIHKDNIDVPLCYKKGSLSVLESVLNAHDMERRWLQSHPAVQYESFLIQEIIKIIDAKISNEEQSLLCYDALTEKGINVNNFGNIRYISDVDILYLAKNHYYEFPIVQEYFNRANRRHPIWKSEAEYKAYFGEPKNDYLLSIIKDLKESLQNNTYGTCCINEQFYLGLKEKLEETISEQKNMSQSSSRTFEIKINTMKNEIKLIEKIKEYLEKLGLKLDLVILTCEQFRRNISKDSFKNLLIRFNQSKLVKQMKELTDINFDDKDSKNYYYIFYKRDDSKKIDLTTFARLLHDFSTDLKFESEYS